MGRFLSRKLDMVCFTYFIVVSCPTSLAYQSTEREIAHAGKEQGGLLKVSKFKWPN